MRPPEQQFAGGAVTRTLDTQQTLAIRALAASLGTTTFNVLTAAYAAVLSRFCAQSELVIGTPVGTARATAGIGDGIGPYVNTVALRVQTDGHDAFGALLDHVVGKSTAAIAHSDVPFEDVVATLALTARHEPHASLSNLVLRIAKERPTGSYRVSRPSSLKRNCGRRGPTSRVG